MTTNFRKFRQMTSVMVMAIFFAVALFLFANPLYAQENTVQSTAVVEDCQSLEQKLNDMVYAFEERKSNHKSMYDELSITYGDIISKLSSASYDVSILRELHPGLDRRIVHFDGESEIFLSELRDVMDSACRDKDSFYQELEEAREALKDVQLSIGDINEYVQNVLLVSVKTTIDNGAVQ